jgi:uncharacterized membrane protein
MHALLLGQAAAAFFMTGLIWIVQVVHYPLMAEVGAERFPRYERMHSRRITWVVAPPMLVEAGLAAVLVAEPPPGIPSLAPWVGLGLVGVIWLSTAFLQVPQHGVLASGFDARAHRRLVATNWVRTVAWSLRSALAVWMLEQAR